MPYYHFGGIPEGPEDPKEYTLKPIMVAVLLITLSILLAFNIARYMGWEPFSIPTLALECLFSYIAGRLSHRLA